MTFHNEYFAMLLFFLFLNFFLLNNLSTLYDQFFLFFIIFIFVVFFILLNMFLAIINDTYSEVKGEMEMTKIQFEITDLFARGYNNILGEYKIWINL